MNKGNCVYTGYKQPSGRISTNFFNTSCGQEYVSRNINSQKCRHCDRPIQYPEPIQGKAA